MKTEEPITLDPIELGPGLHPISTIRTLPVLTRPVLTSPPDQTPTADQPGTLSPAAAAALAAASPAPKMTAAGYTLPATAAAMNQGTQTLANQLSKWLKSGQITQAAYDSAIAGLTAAVPPAVETSGGYAIKNAAPRTFNQST